MVVACQVYSKFYIHSRQREDEAQLAKNSERIRILYKTVKMRCTNKPSSNASKPECETCLETCHKIVKRFLKSLKPFRQVDKDRVRTKLQSIIYNQNCSDAYPKQGPFLLCFSLIKHVPNALKTAQKPTSLTALTICFLLVEQLRTIYLCLLQQKSERSDLVFLHRLWYIFATKCVTE